MARNHTETEAVGVLRADHAAQNTDTAHNITVGDGADLAPQRSV